MGIVSQFIHSIYNIECIGFLRSFVMQQNREIVENDLDFLNVWK